MANILVWTIFLGVLSMAFLVIFLMDRLQVLSNIKRYGPPPKQLQNKFLSTKSGNNLIQTGSVGEDGQKKIIPLDGKALWNVLSGKKQSKKPKELIDSFRNEYKIALKKHITSLFEDAVTDKREGNIKTPSNVKTIEHGGGEMISWLPLRFANDLYDFGCTAAVDRTDGFLLVRKQLESTCATIFKEVGLEGSIGLNLASDLLKGVVQSKVETPKKNNMTSDVMDMLDDSNTYDDKVALVRMFTTEDSSRIAKVIKGMIQT